MHLPVLHTIDDVVAHQLCSGCGACAGVSGGRIVMQDTLEHGRRPRYRGPAPAEARDSDAMRVCPGLGLTHRAREQPDGVIPALLPGWGPVLELWEGHAGDDEVRFRGSSGGAATALALDAIERGGMHGVLHVRARRDAPLLNQTVLSTTRDELLAATGSRYAPASPAEGLPLVERAPAPCVFIGKPCDVAGADRARRLRPALDARLGLTVAIFCAGTPTTSATLALLAHLGVDDPADVLDLRYRGNGWPGETTVTLRTRFGTETRTLSYDEAWGGILTNRKQWRCHVCADHTGEFADVAVGDPWHRPIAPGEPGRSLVLVRTERGRRAVREAMASGALVLEPAEPRVLVESQPNLLRGRGAVWGRLLALRALGVPAPRYRGLPMFRFWWSQLTPGEKLRSLAGTARRVARRGLRRRLDPADLAPLRVGRPRTPAAAPVPRRRAA